MKLKYNISHVEACARVVSRLNNEVLPTPEDARELILSTLDAAKADIRRLDANRSLTNGTAGFVISVSPEFEGTRTVRFYIDPYIATFVYSEDYNENTAEVQL